VTPTKQGFVLTPASANIAITTNDAVADFTAQTFITSLTGRMIFEVSGLIAGMNADGSGLVTLLASDVRSSNRRPALSPDGKKIAFHRPIDANTSQICVVNYDGSNLVCLTSNNFDSDPAWSPDGRRIAFVRRNTIPPTNLNQLFTMNADGTNQTRPAAFRSS
jgi:Tol biopolymer transport system component